MTAFFIAHITVKHLEKFQTYASEASKSVEPFGGKILTKGKVIKNLVGTNSHELVTIISFPNQQNLDDWYASDHYQVLIPLREEATEMQATSYAVPAALQN